MRTIVVGLVLLTTLMPLASAFPCTICGKCWENALAQYPTFAAAASPAAAYQYAKGQCGCDPATGSEVSGVGRWYSGLSGANFVKNVAGFLR